MKSCKECSFYIEDWDIMNLSPADQILYEKMLMASGSDNNDIDIQTLDRLLKGIRKNSCIGGLLKPDEIKIKCNYFTTNTPKENSKDNLLQMFTDKKSHRFSKINSITAFLFSLATLALGILTYMTGSENKRLQNEINQLKKENAVLLDKTDKMNAILMEDSLKMSKTATLKK